MVQPAAEISAAGKILYGVPVFYWGWNSGAIPVMMAWVHCSHIARAKRCPAEAPEGKRQKTEVKLVYGESSWHRAPARIANCRISIKKRPFSVENGRFSCIFAPLVFSLVSHESVCKFYKVTTRFCIFGLIFCRTLFLCTLTKNSPIFEFNFTFCRIFCRKNTCW